jgi:phage terminase large subunit
MLPDEFQTQLLGRRLWDKQRAICTAIAGNRSVAIKGCHGSGKTFVVSGLVPWELTMHDEAIVLWIAPTLRQVKTGWGEISEAIGKMRFRNVPAPTTTRWQLGEKCYAQGFSSSKGVNAQGFHGKRVTIYADEAIGIGADVWDAIEGIRAAGDVRIVKLCNPTVPSGPVYDDFAKLRATPGHTCITISAFDTPNLAGLTLETLLQLPESELDYAPFPWLTRRRWVREMYYKWGPNNPRFQARVMGEFPTQGQWAVFSLAWVERADREPTEAELSRAKGSVIHVGVDVAAGGDDETAACARVNGIILARFVSSEADPRGHLVRWLGQLRHGSQYRDYSLGPVVVDTVGVGHGIALHLADCGFDVRGFKAGAVAQDSEQFLNAKAEAYFRLRDMHKDNYISHVDGAVDEDVKAQLTGVEYRELSRGQIQVEPKEDARKRGLPSPDRAEAQVMAFCRVIPRTQTYVSARDYQISPI